MILMIFGLDYMMLSLPSIIKKKTYLFSVNLDDYQEGTNNLSNVKKLEHL